MARNVASPATRGMGLLMTALVASAGLAMPVQAAATCPQADIVAPAGGTFSLVLTTSDKVPFKIHLCNLGLYTLVLKDAAGVTLATYSGSICPEMMHGDISGHIPYLPTYIGQAKLELTATECLTSTSATDMVEFYLVTV